MELCDTRVYFELNKIAQYGKLFDAKHPHQPNSEGVLHARCIKCLVSSLMGIFTVTELPRIK